MKSILGLAAAVLVSMRWFGSIPAQAGEFPTKPITAIVTVSPSSGDWSPACTSVLLLAWNIYRAFQPEPAAAN